MEIHFETDCDIVIYLTKHHHHHHQGNMRLPPLGYVEKIWDHAPGACFIIEAGGEMTDLSGERIDFSKGRLLTSIYVLTL
jgi:3'-phosphoadenosine 5'-phosphosulfate (PAPS) 3'-phosphatase